MTYFLRDKGNRTVVDLDFVAGDFHVVVVISTFAAFLLSLPSDKRPQFIADMDALQELRGEWWKGARKPETRDIKAFAKDRLVEIGKRWDLWFVED